MKFYDKIMRWKDNGFSMVNSNKNELICLVHKNVENDYLHVLFYPLSIFKQKEFEKNFDLKTNKGLYTYSKFIFEHNGAVLYSGALVFFGYTNKTAQNIFMEPPSLEQMNLINKFVINNPIYLYIGNIMHRDYDNINIFINKQTGYILWEHKNEIFKEFKNLNDMLDFIIEYYDSCYGTNGENLNYKNRNKNVYENIQLF